MAKTAHRSRSISVVPSAPAKDLLRLHNPTAPDMPAKAHLKQASSVVPRRSPRLSKRPVDAQDLATMVSGLIVRRKPSSDIMLVIPASHDSELVVSDKRATAAGDEYRVEAWFPKAHLVDLADEIKHYEVSQASSA